MNVILQDIAKVDTGALIVGFYEDVRPLKGFAGELDWLLCGSLSRLLLEKKLRGVLGDVALLTTQGKVPASMIFMIGLGRRGESLPATLQSAAKTAAASAVRAGVTTAAVEYFPDSGISYKEGVCAMFEGLREGAGGRGLAVALLARDAAVYENVSRFIKV